MPRNPSDSDATPETTATTPTEGPVPPGIGAPQPAADPGAAAKAEAASGTPAPPPEPPADTEGDDEYAGIPVDALRDRARALGALPADGTGSGRGGNVVRDDIVEALQSAPPGPPAGRPPLIAVAEQAAAQIQPREEE